MGPDKRRRSQRSREWVGTIFDCEPHDFTTWGQLVCTYYIFQQERCPTSGRIHLQVYVQLRNQTAFHRGALAGQRGHWAIAKGGLYRLASLAVFASLTDNLVLQTLTRTKPTAASWNHVLMDPGSGVPQKPKAVGPIWNLSRPGSSIKAWTKNSSTGRLSSVHGRSRGGPSGPFYFSLRRVHGRRVGPSARPKRGAFGPPPLDSPPDGINTYPWLLQVHPLVQRARASSRHAA